ncbi:hypothetical protein FLM48_17165 [Shewanella sp. Scap07]|uniref:hypothetical protein n=1 Tax=Shewanella sp. Scap07 TaxID=2589987 RepID=UPI0015B84484|nr:hypothetical protein [Shewanella sp. Scap07]QLE86649.1 hypothetical protein FLM48_17165 [Shewanella sp. Scap07]
MKKTLIALFTLLISGCAQIEQYETISRTLEVPQKATLGSELYRIKKTRDLPNAFGRADVWGGKIDEGYSELRFMGLDPSGKIIFRLTDNDVQSNESVFTRYGTSTTVVNSSTTGMSSAHGGNVHSSANTNATITHYEKPKATINRLPTNTLDFLFNPNDKILQLEGVTVEIQEVKEHSITYVLRKNSALIDSQ